jgi:hypothetical protein
VLLGLAAEGKWSGKGRDGKSLARVEKSAKNVEFKRLKPYDNDHSAEGQSWRDETTQRRSNVRPETSNPSVSLFLARS